MQYKCMSYGKSLRKNETEKVNLIYNQNNSGIQRHCLSTKCRRSSQADQAVLRRLLPPQCSWFTGALYLFNAFFLEQQFLSFWYLGLSSTYKKGPLRVLLYMGYDILEKLVFVSFKRIITKKSHLKSLIFVENFIFQPALQGEKQHYLQYELSFKQLDEQKIPTSCTYCPTIKYVKESCFTVIKKDFILNL